MIAVTDSGSTGAIARTSEVIGTIETDQATTAIVTIAVRTVMAVTIRETVVSAVANGTRGQTAVTASSATAAASDRKAA